MDDIQKAIETLKEMKLFYNPFNKNGEIDTAISAMQELQAYRELEKQKKLMKFPCVVGDVVYTNISATGWYLRKKNRPYGVKIVFIGINGRDNLMNVAYENGNMTQFLFSEIGKNVFLTKYEAEEALERMKDE